MKISFFIVLLTILATASHAQIGLRTSYDNLSLMDLSPSADGVSVDPAYTVGVDYWFRWKKRRVEFMPELGFSSGSYTANGLDHTLTGINARLNVHIYPMDLAEDCDCPTFSKDGGLIKKGFFFHVGPGVSYLTVSENDNTESAITPMARIGAGLDIGLNEFVTITPLVGYNLLWSSGLENDVISTPESFSKLQLGLRTFFVIPVRRRY